MAKKNQFVRGDFVSGKKLNGEHFIGLYVHEYDCGDHLIDDGNKEYCIKKNQCHYASLEEVEEIKETIIKPRKEALKEKTKKVVEEETKNNADEEALASASTEDKEA